MKSQSLVPLRVLPNRISGRDPSARADVSIYLPFFVAGIVSVLTAGCLLGAVALLGISLNSSYTASAWTPYVLAHANSQLYGWVGFFIMGFALQQHAPSVARAQLFHRLAYASLVLMALGIGIRFAAEPLVAVDRGIWLPVGVLSCWMQAVGVGLFLVNTSLTRHRTGEPLPWQSVLVFASLFWFSAVAIAEPFYFARSHDANPREAILFVAKWFPPYREAQFLGFVAMMIFGVAFVKLNSCFGFRAASRTLGLAGFAVWTAGLLLRMGGWTHAFSLNLTADSRLTYHLGGGLLLAGGTMLVMASGLFSKPESTLPSHKFLRAAFGWLLVSGVLMALEPVHLAAIGKPFSHAYIGAIRHAATVGFISQMIVGVALHVVTRMKDVPIVLVPRLWATFWLLNLGNLARVAFEIATDYGDAAFLPMGVTGFVELTGLALWGAALLRYMIPARRRFVGAN